MASTDEEEARVNPAPAGHETAVFVIREVVALGFVAVWLGLLVWDTVGGGEVAVPFWLHCVGVGVLAYALGLNVAELTAYRKPSARGVARAVRGRQDGPPPPAASG